MVLQVLPRQEVKYLAGVASVKKLEKSHTHTPVGYTLSHTHTPHKADSRMAPLHRQLFGNPSTESCLHLYIPAKTRGDREEGKYLSVLFKLNGSASQVLLPRLNSRLLEARCKHAAQE